MPGQDLPVLLKRLPDLISNALALVNRVGLQKYWIDLEICIPGEPSISISKSFPMQMKRRGIEMRLVIEGQAEAVRNDPSLLKTIGRAMRWWDMLTSGEANSASAIAASEGFEVSYVSRVLPLAMLAPEIVDAISEGRQPDGLTSTHLIHAPELPLAWSAQRPLLGFSATA